jgi:hypothetical protein
MCLFLYFQKRFSFPLTLALSPWERELPSPFGRRVGDEGEATLLMGG